jgi:hypothetical protein
VETLDFDPFAERVHIGHWFATRAGNRASGFEFVPVPNDWELSPERVDAVLHP